MRCFKTAWLEVVIYRNKEFVIEDQNKKKKMFISMFGTKLRNVIQAHSKRMSKEKKNIKRKASSVYNFAQD